MSKINNKITVEQSELTKKLIKKMNISFMMKLIFYKNRLR